MKLPNKDTFLQLWPRKLIIFLAIIELLVIVFMILTEVGSMIASFWLTNVFAGIWCGILLLIFDISLFINGCCLPGPKSAFVSVIIGLISLLATIALIIFDSIFISQPSICLISSSCLQNSVSTSVFSYSLQQSFLQQFNNWPQLPVYSQVEAKFVFQVIQLTAGLIAFLFYIIYVVIFYLCVNKARDREEGNLFPKERRYAQSTPPGETSLFVNGITSSQQDLDQPDLIPISPAQQGYYPSSSRQNHRRTTIHAWRPPPRVPQAQPGEIPWNTNAQN